MLQFLENGIEWVLAVQSIGPWLATPMRLVSELGTEPFYLLVMPIVLWCYDYSLGFRVALILSASALSNGMLKLVFSMPRPFWVSAQVRAYSFESSFGLPSGHSQNAVSIWGRLAHGLGRRWAYAAAIGLILLISISRIYLGVHFPLDVLAGWVVGGLLLAGFLAFEEPVWRWFQRQSAARQLLVILLAALLPLFLGLLIWTRAMTQPLPVHWLSLAGAAGQSTEELADPRSFEGFVSVSAVLLGLMIGAWQLVRQGGFDSTGPLTQRAARFALGALGVAVLFFGLDLIEFPEEMLFGQVWRFFRYGLVGYWIAYLAPRLFTSLNLAQRLHAQDQPQ